ncbi:MAG: hypothetical protein AMS15_09670 [Planctomycetes bacterium DG_23]|nr:MAG: hypothetical protein AMS15_09670 [Planctomycetes bacterium DG_23]
MRIKFIGCYGPAYVVQLKRTVYPGDEIEVKDEGKARALLVSGEWEASKPRRRFLEVWRRK